MKRSVLTAALAAYLAIAGTAAATVTVTVGLHCRAGQDGHITWHVTTAGTYTVRWSYRRRNGTTFAAGPARIRRSGPSYIRLKISRSTGLRAWSGSITGPGRAKTTYAKCAP